MFFSLLFNNNIIIITRGIALVAAASFRRAPLETSPAAHLKGQAGRYLRGAHTVKTLSTLFVGNFSK